MQKQQEQDFLTGEGDSMASKGGRADRGEQTDESRWVSLPAACYCSRSIKDEREMFVPGASIKPAQGKA